MSSDPFKKLNEGPVVPAPPRPGTEGTTTHVKKETKVTVAKGGGASTGEGCKGWPKDEDDWKRLARSALPWIAGAAIVIAAGAAYQKSQCEEEKDSMSAGEFAGRKARRAGEAVEEGKEKARSGWFGFKRKVKDSAEETGKRAESAKDAAAKKARETKEVVKSKAQQAKGYVEDKAQDTKDATTHAAWWVGDKAHEAADATKGAARSTVEAGKSVAHKAEHGAAAAGSAVMATAAAGEEKTGAALKEAGQKLEKDGAKSKAYWRGEEVQEEAKKKIGPCTIM